jgi:DNA-binding NarL/FixJ family response regulator
VDLSFHRGQPNEVLPPYLSAATGQKLVSVMIADSHDAIRRGVRSLLATQENVHVIAEAANGREALKIAEDEQPDIAIVDLSLPELNGIDFANALKRGRLLTHVLFYTMSNREDVVLDALRAGARGFVLKEESEQHLLAAIDAISIGRPYFSPAISDKLFDRLATVERPMEKTDLTSRERGIIQLIAEGAINKVIASKLGITTKTVETHRMNAMRKLKIRNTAELVRWAIRNHLVEA